MVSGDLTALVSQFKVLMEHLDHDEEDEEGEASASARNKAINSLLKGSKPLNHNHNHHIVETDEEDSADEDDPVVRVAVSPADILRSVESLLDMKLFCCRNPERTETLWRIPVT